MTTRGIEFRAGVDVSDVLAGFRRVEREAAQTARRVANIGRSAGGVGGRGAGGIGRAVAAGAGIGAGVAIFEQLFMRLFELFEDTPVLMTFTDALDTLLQAFGPVVGVLLEALTPAIVALTPAMEPLARAVTPLIELFGTGLLIAITAAVPVITLVAGGVETLTTGLQTFINTGINFVIDQLNRIPFVDIQLEIATTGDRFDAMAMQIKAAGDEAGTGPDTATGKMMALAGATATVTRQIDNNTVFMSSLQAGLLDAASATELVRIGVAENAATHRAAVPIITEVDNAIRRTADDLDLLEGGYDHLGGATEGFAITLTRAAETVADAAEVAQVAAGNATRASRDARNQALGFAALVNDVGGGGRTSGRYAGPSRDRGSGRITGVREIDGVLFFTTEHGGTEFNAARFGRENEARTFQAANAPPVMVMIDGANVATATTRAMSEGAT